MLYVFESIIMFLSDAPGAGPRRFIVYKYRHQHTFHSERVEMGVWGAKGGGVNSLSRKVVTVTSHVVSNCLDTRY